MENEELSTIDTPEEIDFSKYEQQLEKPEIPDELLKARDIMERQSARIDELEKRITELKEFNMQLANIQESKSPITAEDILAEVFGTVNR